MSCAWGRGKGPGGEGGDQERTVRLKHRNEVEEDEMGIDQEGSRPESRSAGSRLQVVAILGVEEDRLDPLGPARRV
jgi:hypothetical protein